MARLYAHWRQFDKVIATSMSRGRALSLHSHRRRRVAKKYRDVVVFQRHIVTDRAVLHNALLEIAPFLSDKAKRRVCRLLRKHGIDAHVERQCATPSTN